MLQMSVSLVDNQEIRSKLSATNIAFSYRKAICSMAISTVQTNRSDLILSYPITHATFLTGLRQQQHFKVDHWPTGIELNFQFLVILIVHFDIIAMWLSAYFADVAGKIKHVVIDFAPKIYAYKGSLRMSK